MDPRRFEKATRGLTQWLRYSGRDFNRLTDNDGPLRQSIVNLKADIANLPDHLVEMEECGYRHALASFTEAQIYRVASRAIYEKDGVSIILGVCVFDEVTLNCCSSTQATQRFCKRVYFILQRFNQFR